MCFCFDRLHNIVIPVWEWLVAVFAVVMIIVVITLIWPIAIVPDMIAKTPMTTKTCYDCHNYLYYDHYYCYY